jgi:hypothetical protein
MHHKWKENIYIICKPTNGKPWGPTPDESSIKSEDNSNIMWSTKEIESDET